MQKTIPLATLLLISLMSTVAQPKYCSPVDFAIVLAGNVGELRTDAFHAGIDIKAAQGVGSPVRAIADGYVMRVGVSPWGFGNVLYVKHNDGAVSVYAHLNAFIPTIAQWVERQQYASRSFRVDLYPAVDKFVVKQGQQIGMLGNSGTSFGAHLHLEIRDPRTGLPTNLLTRGIYTVPDSESPLLKSVSLYEIDVVNGIEIHRLKERIVVPEPLIFSLRGRGYFVYEVVDHKDGQSNTMGVYSIEQRLDGVLNYRFRMDFADYAKGRYLNTFVEYPAHRASKHDVIRAYVSANNKLDFYSSVVARGVLTIKNQPIAVETTIIDDAGNKTMAYIRITRDTSPFQAVAYPQSHVVRWNKPFAFTIPTLQVAMPSGVLFDDALLNFEHRDGLYYIGTPEVPLLRSIEVRVKTDVASPKQGLVLVGETDKWVGGEYKSGMIIASVNRFGTYALRDDNLAPNVIAVDMATKGSSKLKFTIADNLSGIASYVMTIDSEWVLARYDAKSGELTHTVKRAKTPISHTLKLVVTDGVGNVTTHSKAIVW